MELLDLETLIDTAIKEDIGKGDITTALCLVKKPVIEAQIITNEEGIIAGVDIACIVFKKINEKTRFKKKVEDGQWIKKGDVITSIKGKAQDILAGERVALNFLQHLSGIATSTFKFVEAVKPYPAKIYDTRKTHPGLRAIEKYAVKIGGGNNHRFGLYDGILIKDNHLKIAGGVTAAIKQVQLNPPRGMKIEVETKNLDEVKEAVALGVDVIMLDNMSFEMIREAVKIIKAGNKNILIEVSGGVSLKNVHQIASTGVDIISIGALTHSSKALDLSLEI
ncbi:MAG: carboxylating nicotinate-nucleotide diphosphorylase [bacterium]